jgi:hypothetical protein
VSINISKVNHHTVDCCNLEQHTASNGGRLLVIKARKYCYFFSLYVVVFDYQQKIDLFSLLLINVCTATLHVSLADHHLVSVLLQQ